MNKNILIIARLFRRYDQIMNSGMPITLINTLERFAYGQASMEELQLCFQNVREDDQRGNVFEVVVNNCLTDMTAAVAKVIASLAYLYSIWDKGLGVDESKDCEIWIDKIAEAIKNDDIESLPVLTRPPHEW